MAGIETAGRPRDEESVLIGRVGDHRFALPVSDVVEVHRAVAVTPLPGAPDAITGVVDLRGRLAPVLDLRRRLGLEAGSPDPSDVLIAVEFQGRPLLLAADEATAVEPIDVGRLEAAETLAPGARYLRDVAGTPSGPLVIHDLEAFLSSDESAQLDAALREHTPAGADAGA